jgi:hypothetical protein
MFGPPPDLQVSPLHQVTLPIGLRGHGYAHETRLAGRSRRKLPYLISGDAIPGSLRRFGLGAPPLGRIRRNPGHLFEVDRPHMSGDRAEFRDHLRQEVVPHDVVEIMLGAGDRIEIPRSLKKSVVMCIAES